MESRAFEQRASSLCGISAWEFAASLGRLTGRLAGTRLTPSDCSRGLERRTTLSDQSPRPSPVAEALALASRITGIAAEMAIPPLLGYWADQKLGTKLLLLIVGMVIGFALGLWQLLQLTKRR